MPNRITFQQIDVPQMVPGYSEDEQFDIFRGDEIVGRITFPGGYVTYDNITPWSISRAARRYFGPDVELRFSEYKRGIEKRGHREYNYGSYEHPKDREFRKRLNRG